MKELEVTWARTMQVWWAYFWRGIAYILVPMFLLGVVVGAVLMANKIPIEPHAWKLQLVGSILGLAVGIWITKVILSKTYAGFRIALVAVEAEIEPDLPPNFRTT